MIGEKNKADNRVFWFTNYLFPAIWILLMFVNVMTLSVSNGAVCLFSAGLSGYNLINYRKCDANHGQKMTGEIMTAAKENLTQE